MRKIKVAFFAEILIEDFDGASRTMFQILKRIPSDQFEYLFICGTGPAELYGFACMSIPALTLPVNNRYTLALPYLAQPQLRQKLEAFAPDVIHIATPSMLGNYALDYAQKRSLPVLSIYHTHFISYVDYYLNRVPFLIEYTKARLVSSLRSFYNACNIVYVPSESIAAEMGEMGIDPARLTIWKRGIDISLFSPEKKNKHAMRILTGNDHPVILFASRLVWEKNLETLFRIYDQCESEDLNYNFLIAGDGIARKTCEQRMKKAIFTGAVPHEKLSELYASSDVFLFPSVSESYGNVVLEAMASGLPCIIADGGGSRDFISQGHNGFKCLPDDEADFAEKIKTVLQNEALATQFARHGREYSATFDWKSLTDTYFGDLHNLAFRLSVSMH